MLAMDLYCVMGNPVEHSKSPWIHARFAGQTGELVRYEKRLIALGALAEGIAAFRAEGGRGCNITVPFKFEATALAAVVTPRAALAQACNVLRFDAGGIFADNTDGIGLVLDLTVHAGLDLSGRDLLLLGAGGASAGVMGPLIEARPRRLVVANRTQDKARALVQRHAALAAASGVELGDCALDAVPGAFDVVINGTASSLSGAGVPVSAQVLRPGATALDMMYGPPAQGFMDWARSHGAHARDGLGMLVEQAAEAFALWRGVRPESASVLAALRRHLEGAVRA